MTRELRSNRLWGGALVAFTVVQLVYLYFDLVAMTAPAYGAPMAEFRSMIVANHDMIRWHILLPLFNVFVLLVPASVALKRRLQQGAPDSVWPDLIVPGAVLATVTVVLAEMILAVFGLVPESLSDSVLSVLLMANAYTIFVASNLAGALFVGPASLAMLASRASSRWLGWAGVVTAGTGMIGALWLVGGDTGGPLFGLTVVSRGLLLLWIAAAGVWLYREPAEERAVAEAAAPSGVVVPVGG